MKRHLMYLAEESNTYCARGTFPVTRLYEVVAARTYNMSVGLLDLTEGKKSVTVVPDDVSAPVQLCVTCRVSDLEGPEALHKLLSPLVMLKAAIAEIHPYLKTCF